MLSLTELAATILACIGCGFAGDWIAPKAIRPHQKFVIGTLLGLGVVSILIFILGISQLWRVDLFKGACAVLVVFGAIRIALFAPSVKDFSAPQNWEWLALVLTVVLAGLTLIVACAPVTDWDGLSYHLAVPKLYLRHGGIYWISFIHHSNFPFATEMLYAPAVALGYPSAAKVVHWVYFVLTTCGCGMLANRLFGKCGVWAALAFVLMPVAMWESGAAYIDLATAAYTVLATLAIVNYMDEKTAGWRWLLIAAVSAGMAAGTKTFALVWMELLVVWLIFSRSRESQRWKVVVVFQCVAGVVCLPWYLKSWVMTGNPVYPFLYSVFGGRGWGETGVEMYQATFQKFGIGHSLMNFVMLPWDFLVQGQRFIDGNFFFGSPGPVFATLLPVAFMMLKNRAKQLAIALLAFLAIWFILSQQSRYLLPLLALGCSLIAGATVRGDIAGRASRFAMLIFGGVSVVFAYILAQPVLPVIAGETDTSTYIQREVSSYWITDYLPSDAKVLLYGETRGFLMHQTYMWADMALSSTVPYESFNNARDMIAWFRNRGWNYVVINTRFSTINDPKTRDMEFWRQAIDAGLVKAIGGTNLNHPMAGGIEIWEIP